MKKIEFVCDNCRKTIAVQILTVGEEIENHLKPVSAHEFCIDCCDILIGPGIHTNPEKATFTISKAEIERYGFKRLNN